MLGLATDRAIPNQPELFKGSQDIVSILLAAALIIKIINPYQPAPTTGSSSQPAPDSRHQ
jgi:hypothetical protein